MDFASHFPPDVACVVLTAFPVTYSATATRSSRVKRWACCTIRPVVNAVNTASAGICRNVSN
jgi:hypothetical protein